MNFDEGEHLLLEIPDEAAGAGPIGRVWTGGSGARRGSLEGRPVLSALACVAEAATVALTTLLVVAACRSYEPARSHGALAAGFFVVLTFCLLLRPSRRTGAGWAKGNGHQLRRLIQLAPILLCSAMAGTIVLLLLGSGRIQLIVAALLWTVTSLVALVVVQSVGNYAIRHPSVADRIARRVAVIGHDGTVRNVAGLLTGRSGEPIRLLGVFSDEQPDCDGVTVAGSIDKLVELGRENAIDDIVIAVPSDADALETTARLRWRLRGVAVEVHIMPYLAQGEDVVLPVEMFGPLALVVVQRRPLTHAQAMRKRMFDVTLGLLLLVLLLPLLVVIALVVKLDSPGPVLFRQPRLGFNNQPFTVLKFRSMHANASDLMAARQTSRRDPRVTRVGRWLRKLSLDELPQLLNVLSGDMSLVGPRPHAPQTRAGGRLLKDAMAEYVIRHQVKPGITGWAQVNGERGELVTMDDLRRRVTYDLEYIQQWSVWFDLRIISMTVLREVFSKHAF